MCDLPLKAASICPSSVCWEGLEATDPQVMWNLTPGGQLPDTIVHSKESRIFRDTAGARRGQNEPGMWGTKWESTQSLSCHNNRGSQKTGGFLTVLEAGDPRSRCQQGWFLVRPLSLNCRWAIYNVRKQRKLRSLLMRVKGESEKLA